jgi:hypothetical protein
VAVAELVGRADRAGTVDEMKRDRVIGKMSAQEAIARIYRPGQTRHVTIHVCVAAGKPRKSARNVEGFGRRLLFSE